MAHKIKGNVSTVTAHSNFNPVATSVNSTLPDASGNVEIEFDDYMSGETGDTIIFKHQNAYKLSKLVTVAYIIMLDAELELCKTKTTEGIFDSRNGDVWINTGGVWSIDSTRTLYDVLDKGTIYTNTYIGRAFLINSDNTVSLFTGTSKGTALGQVPGIESFLFSHAGDNTNAVQHYPGGLTIQTVTGTTDANGDCTITLPQAFSTKILSAKASCTTIVANQAVVFGVDFSSSTLSTVKFNARICKSAGVTLADTITFKAIIIGF